MGTSVVMRSAAAAMPAYISETKNANASLKKQFEDRVLFVDFDGTIGNSIRPTAKEELAKLFGMLRMPRLEKSKSIAAVLADPLFLIYELRGKKRDKVNGEVLNGIELHAAVMRFLHEFVEGGGEVIVLTANKHTDKIRDKMLNHAEYPVDAPVVNKQSENKPAYIKKYIEEHRDKEVVHLNDSQLAMLRDIDWGLRKHFVLVRDSYNIMSSWIAKAFRGVKVVQVDDYESIRSVLMAAFRHQTRSGPAS